MYGVRALAAFLAAAALVGTVALAAQDGGPEALVQAKCSGCHGLEVVCNLLGKRDRDGWDWIVGEMQRKGAQVNLDQKRAITDYLGALAPGSRPVCPAPVDKKAAPPEASGPQALVMRACTRCHDTRRICQNLRVKAKDGWDRTVTMMMFKGADIDVAQKLAIVDYLYGLPAGAKPICP